MFSNELTRALELLLEIQKNSILLHETLSLIKLQRVHAMRAIHTLKLLTKKPEKEGEEAVIMLLGVYCAFPDLADIGVFQGVCKAAPKNRTVLLLLLKALLVCCETQENIDISLFLEVYIDQRIGQDRELDYLFISLICLLSEKGKTEEQLITMLQEKIERVSNETLSPKLVYLAALSSLQYRVPITYLSMENPTLYLRIMDALCFCGSVCPKERFLEIIPEEKDQFERHFSRYIHKEELPFVYSRSTEDRAALYNVYSLSKILREFVETRENTKEEIDRIKEVLRAHLSP